MGRIYVTLTLSSFFEAGREMTFEALVDTGAYAVTLPREWKERLGPLPIARVVDYELADSRRAQGEVCGPVRIQVQGLEPVSGEVLFADMQPADGRYEPLLGYITLEQLGLAVDALSRRLVRIPCVDLKRTRVRAA